MRSAARSLAFVLLAAALTACASTVPSRLATAPSAPAGASAASS
jgi:hypothetical protein